MFPCTQVTSKLWGQNGAWTFIREYQLENICIDSIHKIRNIETFCLMSSSEDRPVCTYLLCHPDIISPPSEMTGVTYHNPLKI
jgi:hypothetical protein